MKSLTIAIMALTLSVPGSAHAQVWDVGPAVGTTVPALQATDPTGKPVRLRDLSGKSGLVIVFFRSAKWCPYCQKQLIDLKAATEPLAARGYRLAAISYDPPDVLAAFANKRGIAYPLLSDVGSVTIDAWKLRDTRYKPDSFAWGVPYASIYILSPRGTLKAKLAEEDYKVRPPLEVMLSSIDSIAAPR